MSNLRIIHDNAISRSVLTATSTAGALVPANLQADKKSSVWRANTTSERLNAVFPDTEVIQAVALPFCNLSPTAKIRVRTTFEAITTNLFTYTESFDNAAWTKVRSTVPSTTAAAPDGSAVAEVIQGDGSGAAYVYQGKTLAAGQQYAVSVFVKAGTYTGQFAIQDFSESGSVSLNLTTLVVTTSGIYTFGRVVDVGGGWYRLSALFTPTVAGLHNIGFWNVATTGTIQLWGAMLTTGALSSYYPSLGASNGTRPRGYIDSWQGYSYDSGFVSCCPAPAVTLRGWTKAQAASAYANGGGATAIHWLPAARSCSGLAVDIYDPDNLQGYVEAACFVAGGYWSPKYGPASAQFAMRDTTELYLTDAGDQMTEAGTVRRRVSIDLGVLSPEDRTAYTSITRNSRAYPILLSVFTGVGDLERERDYTVYGRRTRDAEIATAFAGAYSITDEIEEI